MTPDEHTRPHEAGHAASALLLSIPVRLVDVVGNQTCAGFVDHAHKFTDVAGARRHAIMVLCGPAMGNRPGTPMPEWPLRDDTTPDERQLKAIADAIRLTQADWHGLVAEAWRLTATAEFERLHTAIVEMLRYTSRIGADTLDILSSVARKAAT